VFEVDLVFDATGRRDELNLEHVHVRRKEETVERIHELRWTEHAWRAIGRSERREGRGSRARGKLRPGAEARGVVERPARAARDEERGADAGNDDRAKRNDVANHDSSFIASAHT